MKTVSANVSPSVNKKDHDLLEQFRRRSEGSEPSTYQNSSTRRVSLSSSPVLKCRYSKCGRIAFAASNEGVAFKNCHNCSYVYCSRTCRRAHWDKHRKSCLFSRIGTLCRQVIAMIKSQKEILLHLSSIARRGYLSHGLGTVKCFFPNSESAEVFLSKGIQALGDLTYLRWQDILPNEMGPNMYAELIKMCKNYKPDSKLVLYVSICVMSPTPSQGFAKWERQLVSRCAKMRLSKEIPIPDRVPDNPETLILTCPPLFAENSSKIRELKEECVQNVQKQLRKRGVSLRRQHPEVFKQLADYSEGNCLRFTPVTLYPTDVNTGKTFMCIIMLEADNETIKQVETAAAKFKTIDVFRNF